MKIPKLSAPLTKAIRTTEGILTIGVAALIAITSGIDPHTLSRKEAGILLAITNGAFLAQRGIIKVVALIKGLGVAPALASPQIDDLLKAITAQTAAIEKLIAPTAIVNAPPQPPAAVPDPPATPPAA